MPVYSLVFFSTFEELDSICTEYILLYTNIYQYVPLHPCIYLSTPSHRRAGPPSRSRPEPTKPESFSGFAPAHPRKQPSAPARPIRPGASPFEEPTGTPYCVLACPARVGLRLKRCPPQVRRRPPAAPKPARRTRPEAAAAPPAGPKLHGMSSSC